MLEQVGQAFFKGIQVFAIEVFLFYAAVVLEGAHRRDNDDRVGFQAGHAAFDVEEFFSAQVGTEAGLCDHVIICEMHGHLRGDDGIAAVGDIGEGAAVDEGGRAFQGLYQIGL